MDLQTIEKLKSRKLSRTFKFVFFEIPLLMTKVYFPEKKSFSIKKQINYFTSTSEGKLNEYFKEILFEVSHQMTPIYLDKGISKKDIMIMIPSDGEL